MGFFNKKTTTTTLEPMKEKWQLDTGKAIADMSQGAIKNYTPGAGYGGKFTAGTTPFEQQSLGILQQYMSDPQRQKLFGAGQQQLLDTMSGKFADPRQSPYLQAMQKIGLGQLDEQIDASRASRGAGPSFFSSQTGAQEGKLRGNYLDTMAALTGQFTSDERNKAFQAAGPGINAGNPLSVIQAGQSYGALNRTVEQSELEKQYQDWLTGRGELQGGVAAGQNVFGTPMDYGVKQFEKQSPSTFDKIMQVVGPAMQGMATGATGVPSGGGSMIENLMQLFQKGPTTFKPGLYGGAGGAQSGTTLAANYPGGSQYAPPGYANPTAGRTMPDSYYNNPANFKKVSQKGR